MKMTLEQVLSKYDKAVNFYLHEKGATGIGAVTLKNYGVSLAKFRENFQSEHCDEPGDVADPSYLDFQIWRDRMIAEGRSVGTIQRRLADLRTFFTFCCDEALGEMRIYDSNPVSKRIVPSNRKELTRPYDDILSDEQVTMLWDYKPNRAHDGVEKATAPRNYAIIMLFLCTEIRNEELRNLKVSDLDFEYGEIQIRHGKGDKYRCIDFPEMAQIAVKLYLQSGLRPEHLTDDDYLFGSLREQKRGASYKDAAEWHQYSRVGMTELVRRHVKRVTGVDMVRSHDLRHIGARLDLHNGMRAEELQAKLGHSHFQTTQIYCGRLGTNRKRTTAKEVYQVRDVQCEKNKMRLEGAC